jgi:hypothetical protein
MGGGYLVWAGDWGREMGKPSVPVWGTWLLMVILGIS